MRVMRAHDQDEHSPLVSFCEVVSHDPFFLIGKPGPFRLADLPAKRFASVSEVPTPWMCLQQDLRDHGIDPDKLSRMCDRTMTRNYDALKAATSTSCRRSSRSSRWPKKTVPARYFMQPARAGRPPTRPSSRPGRLRKAPRRIRGHDPRHGEDAGLALRQSSRGACRGGGVVLPRCPERHPGKLAAPLQRRRPLVPRDPDDPAGLPRLAQSLHSGRFIARMPSYDECVEPTLNAIR